MVTVGLAAGVMVVASCGASASNPPAAATPVTTAASVEPRVSHVEWAPITGDADPGFTVVEAISSQLDVPFASVTAAVVGTAHPRGNSVFAWVFRVRDASGSELVDRWVAGDGERRCESAPVQGELAGRPALRLEHVEVERCLPEYVVLLDERTVAVAVDSAGPHGELPELPYLGQQDMADFVVWLEDALRSIELRPGSPPTNDG